MARPPNIPTNSPNRQWSAPATVGSILRNAVSQHANKVRQFRLPIPPTPIDVRRAIEESVTAQRQQQPFAAQQNRIRTLTTKLHDQRAKAVASQAKLVALETAKEEGLRGIRETLQQETQQTVQNLERKWRSRHNKEAAAAELQWKEQLEEQCEAKRDELRKHMLENSSQEPALKRLKLLEEAAKAAVKGDDDSQDVPQDDVIVALIEPAVSAVEVTSDFLQKQADAKVAAVDEMEQSRREMINLLKEVIKAEGKQKAKLALEAKQSMKKNSPSNRPA